MPENRYLEKIAKSTQAEIRVKRALSSRVPVKKHSILADDDRNRLTLQKTSILEKRALSSISKGFKKPPSTSGMKRLNLKPPKADTKPSVPDFFNQKVDNPNKSLVKASSATRRVKDFTSNLLSGTALGAKSTMQHAGGKSLRDFARASKVNNIERFMRLPDADKAKLIEKKLGPEGSKQLKELLVKRDVSKLAVGGAGVATLYAGSKANKKIKAARNERRKKQLMRHYSQYYGR